MGMDCRLPSATTDGDDFLSVIEIDTVNVNGDTQDLHDERDREMLLQHGQEADTLFRVAVGIDDGLLRSAPQVDAWAAAG
jgi:hypothetical protein